MNKNSRKKHKLDKEINKAIKQKYVSKHPHFHTTESLQYWRNQHTLGIIFKIILSNSRRHSFIRWPMVGAEDFCNDVLLLHEVASFAHISCYVHFSLARSWTPAKPKVNLSMVSVVRSTHIKVVRGLETNIRMTLMLHLFTFSAIASPFSFLHLTMASLKLKLSLSLSMKLLWYCNLNGWCKVL